MAKKNLVTLAEIHEATVFLHAIGAPTSNANMIYAVVAWLRYAHPQDIWVMRNGQKINIASKNKDRAIQDLAKKLLKGADDWHRYHLIIASARSGSQFNFLDALAYSWARGTGMYGWNEKDITTNALYREYVTFTGMQQVVPTPPIVKKLPLPVVQLAAPATPLEYLDPYRVAGFYRARHQVDRNRAIK
jgi:hypothetical protein